jgi:hypothetical protein
MPSSSRGCWLRPIRGRTEGMTVRVKRGWAMRANLALALVLGCSVASSQVFLQSKAPPVGRFGFDRSGLVRVGHEPMAPDPTIRRYTGMVAGLGPPDAEGKLYTFMPSPVGPRNFSLSHDVLRGWRMTMLSGRHFAEVFRVSGNTESEITVHPDNGPIDGFDVRDLFIIESIDANGASMFAPGTGSAPAAPGV